jgi:hypothetical protein
VPDFVPSTCWIGLAAALASFSGIVCLEPGHALVARAVGIPVRAITRFHFGGVAELEGEATSARSQFLMLSPDPPTVPFWSPSPRSFPGCRWPGRARPRIPGGDQPGVGLPARRPAAAAPEIASGPPLAWRNQGRRDPAVPPDQRCRDRQTPIQRQPFFPQGFWRRAGAGVSHWQFVLPGTKILPLQVCRQEGGLPKCPTPSCFYWE